MQQSLDDIKITLFDKRERQKGSLISNLRQSDLEPDTVLSADSRNITSKTEYDTVLGYTLSNLELRNLPTIFGRPA